MFAESSLALLTLCRLPSGGCFPARRTDPERAPVIRRWLPRLAIDTGESLWTSLACRVAGHDSSVGQRHAPRIHQPRSLLGAIAVADERVADLDVAALEAAARQSA